MYTLWFVYEFLIFVRLAVRKKNKGLIIVIIWEKCTDEVFRLNIHFSKNHFFISTLLTRVLMMWCDDLWAPLLFYLFHSNLFSHSPHLLHLPLSHTDSFALALPTLLSVSA